jgi:FtsH-binding integral membrane protein
MSDFNRGFSSIPAGRADMAVDAGLRAFMLGVYNKLALGLVVAGAFAYVVGNVPAVTSLLYQATPDGRLSMSVLGWIVMLAPIGLVMASSFTLNNPNARNQSLFYWATVSAMGASLGWIFLAYTQSSILSTFLITAASFGALSLAGYTTKRDLTGFGSFLFMGLIGLILASFAQIFLHLPSLMFVINVLGLFIFAGLTAYKTQWLKTVYYQVAGSGEALGAYTSYGALSLFITFVNLFLTLLRIMGGNRR